MLEMPRRSVTRFFIPLIDVLTLLFCIYLLMPMIGEPEESEAKRRQLEDQLRAAEHKLRDRKEGTADAGLQAEVERLRQEKKRALQDRLAVRVLEIGGRTGKLYYRDPDRLEVRDQKDAVTLVERDRRQAGGRRELYYLVLYPRTRSAYPTREQLARYQRWFTGVALGFDRPGAEPGGGRP
jgi:hypothetical protein